MATEKLTILLDAKDNASAGLKSVRSAVNSVGKAAAKIAAVGIAAMTAEMVFSVNAANAQENADKQLEAVLKSTGRAAGLAYTQLKDMAAGLQEVTTYGDEVVQSAQGILLTFTNIGADVFPDVLERTLDIATALGTDLKSAAIQLGKAVNDPIKGIDGLSRAGIQFTDTQKDMIKQMVESGDTMGAQKALLGELEKQFGGSARKATETFSGALKQATNSFGDMQEEIGFVNTKSKGMRDGLNATSKFFKSLTNDVVDNRTFLRSLVADGISKVVNGFIGMFEVVSDGRLAFNLLEQSIGEMIRTIADNPVLKYIIPDSALEAIREVGHGMTISANEGIDAATKMRNSVSEIADTIRSEVLPAFRDTSDIVSDVTQKAGDMAAAVRTVPEEFEKFITQLETAKKLEEHVSDALDGLYLEFPDLDAGDPIQDSAGSKSTDPAIREGIAAIIEIGDAIGKGVGHLAAGVVASIVAAFVDLTAEEFNELVGFMAPILSWLSTATRDSMREAVESFSELFAMALKNIGPFVEVVMENIDDILVGLFDGIISGIISFISHIPAMIAAVVGSVGNFFTEGIKKIGEGIRQVFYEAINALIKILNKIPAVHIELLRTDEQQAAFDKALAEYDPSDPFGVKKMMAISAEANTPGFATGGQFTVGGSGGTDSQLIAFKATPGEQVSIKTPDQQMQGQSQTNIIQIQSADNPEQTANSVLRALQSLVDSKRLQFDPIRNEAVA